MYEYYKRLKKINEDFVENREKYFLIIKEIVKKYEGKAYLFGSFLKGSAIAASDIEILIEIPNNVYWADVLNELKSKINNPKFEFHVYNKEEAEIIKKLIKDYKEI